MHFIRVNHEKDKTSKSVRGHAKVKSVLTRMLGVCLTTGILTGICGPAVTMASDSPTSSLQNGKGKINHYTVDPDFKGPYPHGAHTIVTPIMLTSMKTKRFMSLALSAALLVTPVNSAFALGEASFLFLLLN